MIDFIAISARNLFTINDNIIDAGHTCVLLDDISISCFVASRMFMYTWRRKRSDTEDVLFWKVCTFSRYILNIHIYPVYKA